MSNISNITPVEHVLYDNEVIAVKLDSLLETKLNAQNFMTIDSSLQGQPGMRKTIYTYAYEGQLERLEMGQGNTISGKVTFTEEEHKVEVAQQMFQYQDEQVWQDPRIMEVAIKGMAETMFNDMNAKFFEEIAKAEIALTITGALKYEHVVDALELFVGADAANEDEAGLYLLVGTKMRNEIRKDADFINSRQGEILYHGQVGSVCGVPVVHSRSIGENEAYLISKEAVTCFVKNSSQVEQDREPNTRTNYVYGRKVNLVALTDKTKIVKITR